MQPCPFSISAKEFVASSDNAICVTMVKPRYGVNEIRELRGRVFVKIPMGKTVCYADITEAFTKFTTE